MVVYLLEICFIDIFPCVTASFLFSWQKSGSQSVTKWSSVWIIDWILITDVPYPCSTTMFVWNIIMKEWVCHKYIALILFWKILYLWLEILTERERQTSVLATLEATVPLRERVAAILSHSDIIDIYIQCPWNYKNLSMTKFSWCMQNIVH